MVILYLLVTILTHFSPEPFISSAMESKAGEAREGALKQVTISDTSAEDLGSIAVLASFSSKCSIKEGTQVFHSGRQVGKVTAIHSEDSACKVEMTLSQARGSFSKDSFVLKNVPVSAHKVSKSEVLELVSPAASSGASPKKGRRDGETLAANDTITGYSSFNELWSSPRGDLRSAQPSRAADLS